MLYTVICSTLMGFHGKESFEASVFLRFRSKIFTNEKNPIDKSANNQVKANQMEFYGIDLVQVFKITPI